MGWARGLSMRVRVLFDGRLACTRLEDRWSPAVRILRSARDIEGG